MQPNRWGRPLTPAALPPPRRCACWRGGRCRLAAAPVAAPVGGATPRSALSRVRPSAGRRSPNSGLALPPAPHARDRPPPLRALLARRRARVSPAPAAARPSMAPAP
eukprot:3422307-Pleurochrysis_carterae.AAC.3